jgi:hypothetical protein
MNKGVEPIGMLLSQRMNVPRRFTFGELQLGRLSLVSFFLMVKMMAPFI